MTDTTPTREEMIKKIYEVIADKTLSFGCKVHYLMDRGKREWYHIVWTDLPNCWFHWWLCEDWRWRFDESGESRPAYQVETDEIIWHPVMIWDVLDWIEVNSKSWIQYDETISFFNWEVRTEINDMFILRGETRKPIEEQHDQCIAFIHSLLPDEQR